MSFLYSEIWFIVRFIFGDIYIYFFIFLFYFILFYLFIYLFFFFLGGGGGGGGGGGQMLNCQDNPLFWQMLKF